MLLLLQEMDAAVVAGVVEAGVLESKSIVPVFFASSSSMSFGFN